MCASSSTSNFPALVFIFRTSALLASPDFTRTWTFCYYCLVSITSHYKLWMGVHWPTSTIYMPVWNCQWKLSPASQALTVHKRASQSFRTITSIMEASEKLLSGIRSEVDKCTYKCTCRFKTPLRWLPSCVVTISKFWISTISWCWCSKNYLRKPSDLPPHIWQNVQLWFHQL